jgi:signal transduction histidine kinase
MIIVSSVVVYLSLFTSLIFSILLFIVLVANAKSRINQVFALFLFSGAIWGFFIGLWGLNITSYQEYLFGTIATIFGIFPAMISYFFFGLIFLRKPFKLWLLYAIPTYLFFSYLIITGAVVSYVEEPFPGGFGVHQRAVEGDFLLITVAWGGSFVGILTVHLIKELFKKGADKAHLQKVRLLLFDSIAVSSLVIAYNVRPNFWNFPLDIVGMLLAAVILTYGILRFELVDVNVRLRNTLVNIIFAIFLAVVYSLLIISIRAIVPDRLDSYIWWPAIIAAIYITSISLPLRERLLRFIDITFYRTRYDYRETINKFAARVGEILELEKLSSSIIKTIEETFGAEPVHLFVFQNGKYESLECSTECYFEENDPFMKFVNKNNNIICDEELNKTSLSEKRLEHIRPSVIIPLKAGESLVGILSVGQRVSGDFYSQEDKNLLSTLAQAAAIALKNALLYQEVVENKEEIESLLKHEREVNESKNEFVNIVSHYLRTPLTTTKGYLDLVLGGGHKPEEEKEYLNRAYNEQKRLSSLVEDLISISALEKGKLKLFKTDVALSPLINKVVGNFTSLAKEKDLDLKLEFSNEPGKVSVDAQKIEQAISNLVDNAIKFTKIGRVVVSARRRNSHAEICVKDTGIGIDAQQLPKIFRKFHRGTSVETFDYEGSGLGLHITKLIVEAHGGKIDVSSQLGKGSTFCIQLPIK